MIDVPLAGPPRRIAWWKAGVPLVGLAVGVAAVLSPLAAIALVLGSIYMAVAFSNLAAGVVIFVLLSFLERLPGFHGSDVTAIKGAALVLLLAWLAQIAASRGRLPLLPREHPIIAYGAAALIAIAAASLLWAADGPIAESNALRLAQGPLLAAIVFSGLREERHIRWGLGAYVAGAVVTASLGFFWTRSDEADLGRLSGGIGDPNELAAALLPAIPVALFAIAVVRSAFLRWTLVVCLVIMSAAVFMTGSRGGLVGMGVMFLVALVLAGPFRQQVLFGILSVTGVALVYYTLLAPPEVLGRITKFESGSGRTDLWSVALQMASDHPLLGVGAGNFEVLEPTYALSTINISSIQIVLDAPKVAHNTYLHILVELGVLGLVCFCLVLGGAIVVALRALRVLSAAGNRGMEILLRGYLIGASGMLAAYTFISGQYSKELWLLIGLMLAFENAARASGLERAPRRRERRHALELLG